MNYNTELKRMPLPEYGRNIQNMVDHCITIPNASERKRCANTIIDIMGNMFPHLRDVNDFKHILWDHLAIMADFKLEIDYPYEVVRKEDLNTRPAAIAYSNSRIHYRHYGKILEILIQKATEMAESPEKDRLVRLLGNQMKKSFLLWNKESVEDRKIFKDLEELSNGAISLNKEEHSLLESKALLGNGNGKGYANNNSNSRKNNNRKNR